MAPNILQDDKPWKPSASSSIDRMRKQSEETIFYDTLDHLPTSSAAATAKNKSGDKSCCKAATIIRKSQEGTIENLQIKNEDLRQSLDQIKKQKSELLEALEEMKRQKSGLSRQNEQWLLEKSNLVKALDEMKCQKSNLMRQNAQLLQEKNELLKTMEEAKRLETTKDDDEEEQQCESSIASNGEQQQLEATIDDNIDEELTDEERRVVVTVGKLAAAGQVPCHGEWVRCLSGFGRGNGVNHNLFQKYWRGAVRKKILQRLISGNFELTEKGVALVGNLESGSITNEMYHEEVIKGKLSEKQWKIFKHMSDGKVHNKEVVTRRYRMEYHSKAEFERALKTMQARGFLDMRRNGTIRLTKKCFPFASSRSLLVTRKIDSESVIVSGSSRKRKERDFDSPIGKPDPEGHKL